MLQDSWYPHHEFNSKTRHLCEGMEYHVVNNYLSIVSMFSLREIFLVPFNAKFVLA